MLGCRHMEIWLAERGAWRVQDEVCLVGRWDVSGTGPALPVLA